jgi:3-oxoacyl-[acyl-carrier-protein] synthase-1
MPNSKFHVVGLGARTPVGLNLAAATAAVRAGLAEFNEHEYMVDYRGDSIIVAKDALLSADDPVALRVSTLASSAIEEAVVPLLQTENSLDRRFHLLLGLPAPRPGVAASLPDQVAGAIVEALGSKVSLGTVEVISHGHGAGLLAISKSLRQLAAEDDDLFLIAAGDSYMDADTMDWLQENDQLHTVDNPRGFIPGEAAGAVVLCNARTSRALGLRCFGAVSAVGVANEENLIKTGGLCLGHGLTQAIDTALAELPHGERVHKVICDMNGEPYRADEYGYARVRTSKAFWSPSDFSTPADCWGDVGAASGVLFIGLACTAAARQACYGSHVLVWTSSENGIRTAALLDVSQPAAARP